ncbi:MAG: dihydropteroate synthase [Planctomycetes bacterium]|nr:dihydropteroate synthase [Planctomycetota bacterium]
MTRQRILFVTGRLAERPLRRLLERLSEQVGFDAEVAVMGISVAALMQVEFLQRKLTVPAHIDRVVVPGWCQGSLTVLQEQFGKPFEHGPKDLHELPEYFGQKRRLAADLSKYDIEILAEINHAPRLDDAEIVDQALALRHAGADVIDLGCIPGGTWNRVGVVTRQLKEAGLRVSIDSFNQAEVEEAVAAGAELVLSVNATNRNWAARLPAELVAIPDDPRDLTGLKETVAVLQDAGARFRIDPILEPIGFGFAASLGRYLQARELWPEANMLMGVGNLTELTEVDSAGVNVVLAGFCQETGIRSILTTQVIPWCQTAVREFDLARRLVHHAVQNQVLPKHVAAQLVMLRDLKRSERTLAELEELATGIQDPNFRIFAEQGELHVMNRDGHRRGTDPFALLPTLGPLDPSHAFYLGYELAKAVTALTLGKNYRQDEALDWGFLTRPEISARHRSEAGPRKKVPDDRVMPPEADADAAAEQSESDASD